MDSSVMEKILNNIANKLMADPDYPFEDTLLTSEVEQGMCGVSIFKDLGSHLLYRSDDIYGIGYIIYDFWEMEEPKKRWETMEFIMRAGRFKISFTYPGEVDAEIDSIEYRDEIIRKYFGDKPVVYPPMSSSNGGQIFDL